MPWWLSLIHGSYVVIAASFLQRTRRAARCHRTRITQHQNAVGEIADVQGVSMGPTRPCCASTRMVERRDG